MDLAPDHSYLDAEAAPAEKRGGGYFNVQGFPCKL